MHIAYCDESLDLTRTVASALVVPDYAWRSCFDLVRDFRRSLRRRYQIPVQFELHSKDLIGGRGMPWRNSTKRIGRALGCTIYNEAILTLNALGVMGAYGVNVSLTNSNFKHPLRAAVTRLFQRIENNLTNATSGEFGLVIYDGMQAQRRTMAQRVLRRMQVFNPVPSSVNPGSYRMMPVRRILGDPLIRDSQDDIFIQMADIMAYALLRQDNPPTHPTSVRHGIAGAFGQLTDLWLKAASAGDPQGVVRR